MDRAVHAFAAEGRCVGKPHPVELPAIRRDPLASSSAGSERTGHSSYAQNRCSGSNLPNLARVAYGRTRTPSDENRPPRIAACASLASRKTAPLPQAPPPRSGASSSFIGLLAFEDPLREDVPAAVAERCAPGVAVAMITGDYPATALAIARQAGINSGAGVLTGAEIAATPSELRPEKIRNMRVFARVTPTSKLALVEAFKADGHIVAMTGDGVNDGPGARSGAYRHRHGPARLRCRAQAAHIVLADDSFASIVAGVALGRRIFANLRRALTDVMGIHIPIAGVALAPILMGLPPLSLPAHVVLMELIIDPTCALAFKFAAVSNRRHAHRGHEHAMSLLFGSRELWLARAGGMGCGAG